MATLLVVAHTPIVRTRVLAWVIGLLESRYDLVLSATALNYNIVTGTATLDDVSLAARGHEDAPFFAASHVRADVPLSTFGGALVLDQVDVVGGRVRIVTSADGVTNLPGGDAAAEPPVEPRSLAIRGLMLEDLAFEYDNAAAGTHIAATGVDADLGRRFRSDFDGILGPFAIRNGVDLRFGGRTLRVEPIDSTLGFDGRNVWLQDLPLETPLVQAAVTGRIDRVLDAPALDLAFDGGADLAEITTWVASPVSASGTPVIKGHITGRTSAVTTTIQLDGSGLTIGGETALTASLELTVDGAHVEGHRLQLSPASGGQAEATFVVPFEDGQPVRVDATLRGIDTRVPLRLAGQPAQPIGARLDGQVSFASAPQRTMTIRLDATELAGAGLTPLGGRLTAGLNGDNWTATPALRVPGTTVSGTTSGRISNANAMDTTIGGALTLIVSSLADTSSSLAPFGVNLPDAVAQMAGIIEADVALAGTVGDPGATIAARADALDLPTMGEAAISADIVADRRHVAINPIKMVRGEAVIAGNVDVDLEARRLGGALEATSPDMRQLFGDVPEPWQPSGPLSVTASLDGSLDTPALNVTIDSPTVVFAGETFEALHGTAVVTDTGVDVTMLSLRKDQGRIQASGRYGFDRSYAINLDISDFGWQGAIVADTTTRATVTGRFTGEGTIDEPFGRGQFTVAVTGGAAGDLIGEGTADVALAGDHARVAVHLPALGAFANGTVTLASPFDYHAIAIVNAVELEELLPFVGGQITDVTGRMSVTASVNGQFGSDARPRVLANVQEIDASIAGVPLSLVSPAQLTWADGELTVKEMVAILGTSTITAYGTLASRPDAVFFGAFRGELSEVMTASRAFGIETTVTARGPVAIDFYTSGTTESTVASVDLSGGQVAVGPNLSFSGLNLNAGMTGETVTIYSVASRVTGEKLSGTFSASGNATMPELDPARTSGTFTIDTAQFDAAGVVVTQTRPSTFSIADKVLTLDDVQWEAENSAINIGGTVDMRPEGAPALDLQTSGVAVLRVLSAVAPTLGFAGTADLDVHIGGTTEKPDLSGAITLNRAEIAIQWPRFVVSELNGPITLSGNRIEVRGLGGSANGGQLVVDGGFVLDGASLAAGELHVQLQGAALEFPRGLRSEVDALITFDVNGTTPLLAGDVRILRSAYTETISLAALARNANTSAPASAQPSAFDDMRFNIWVTTVEDLVVNNNYGRFEGGASLRLMGTAGSPGLTGRVTLREGGQIFAIGRTFTLNRGTVTFANPTLIEPDLDIEAQTRVTSRNIGDVTLVIQGTPSTLTTDLSSSEGATSEDIAVALLGGGSAGAGALTLLSADILGATGQQLGLSSLRLDREDIAVDDIREDPGLLASDEDPTTRLTLSKQISERVEVTVSQNLRESGNTTFIISYFPVRNLEVRAISRDNSDVGIGLRHLLQFGGTPPAGGTVRAAAPDIAGIGFQGELAPLTEEDLRGHLRLRPGDRFEFYRWQQDIDRLTEVYTDLDFLEARVRSNRTDRKDGPIDLTVTVERGPLSRIVVEGITLSQADERSIREAWQQSVFERFLIQDAEAIVQRRLLSDGHIEGRVTGTVETDEEAKTLRLEVQPGVRAERREIRFTGNTIPTSRLDDVVERSGQGIDAWIDPQRLVEALQRFYVDEGFLQASVTTEPPRLEDTVGILQVVIDEGAQATIGTVDLSGVHADRDAMVRKALGLETPMPYTAAAVAAARQRVDRQYRRLGFNTVTVRTAVDGEPGAPQTLTVTVEEGPEEILRKVETVGDTRTRPGVIDSALSLKVGEPVNLEEWAQSRRRLFDTNVFRVVDIEAVPMGDPVDGIQDILARVRVEEYAPWRLRYGFQLDRERLGLEEDGARTNNFGGIVDLRNQNLFGRALTGGVAARVERDYLNGSVFLSNASMFGLPVRSSLFGYTTRENVRDEDGDVLADTEEVGVSVEQRWRRRRGFDISYGYRFEHHTTYLPGISEPLAIIDIGKITAAVIWDRRNDRLNATRGTFSSVSWDHGAEWLGSDARYAKLLGIQQLFVPVGPIVLASRGMYGDSFGGVAGSVVRDDRFFAGGATTVRGYAEDSLGARDLFGIPLGGEKMIVLNQELRFPIRGWVSGVTFVDAGNVFNVLMQEESQSLKLGYGLGIRLNSPIGLLRLDFGIPADELPSSTRQANSLKDGRWYFGFGHIF